MSVLLGVLVLLVLAVAAGVIWNKPLKSLAQRLYQAAARGPVAATKPTEETHQYYTCGMHPWVILPKPGDCPICHMKLVPLDPAKFSKEVAIDPIMTQNIGVRVSPVVSGPVTRVIRTVGTVDYDEALVRDVNLKISGWVEKLYVTSIGQPVEKDQPLLEIYSPDLYSAQVDYLLALKGRKPSTAPPSDMGSMDADLLAAARKRLEYFDISPQQIEELEKSGQASKTMMLRSPFRGTVVMKNVLDGQKVDAGMQLLRIADLSHVWIMVTVYEYQVPYIEAGQSAVMTLPYMPGQEFKGKVTYIYPYLNAELRQATVRLEFDNPDLLLKPGMYAKVELRRALATDRTLVPREAVIDTGERQIALVSLGEGRFEPRRVQVGVEAEGGMLEILDGLKPGEQVVTSSEFLLDSEARLREALAKMVKGTEASEQKTQAAGQGASEVQTLPDAAGKALSGVLDGYLDLWTKLSSDTIEGVQAPARRVADNLNALVQVSIPQDEHFWHTHTETGDISGRAIEMIDAKDIGTARQKFADLSVALRKLVKATGVPQGYGKEIDELHCPMYREKQGGTIWMQTAGEVRNPYYGKAMLGCFDTRFALPVTGSKAEGQK